MIFPEPIDGDFFESLGNGDSIIYSRTDEVEKCFDTKINHKVLITHNCDRNVDENLYRKFKECGRYEMWYAQNVDCIHEDLKCIPIGLERKRWCDFNKYDVIKRCVSTYVGSPKRILYANFSIGTKPDKRTECIQYFYSKEYLTNKVKNYVPNAKTLSEAQYEQYCMDILNHMFVLCPQGNGIDTHRFWETLYLGRIPVAIHNKVVDTFNDIAVLKLNSWDEFEHKKDLFIETFDEFQYSYNSLDQKYWRNMINITQS